MFEKLREWMRGAEADEYRRLCPLVLINGLAEQAESWFCNRAAWSRHFDLKVPELLVYDGPRVQARIDQGMPITVEYLADELELYLDRFVQTPPYHLVASSLGCQVAVEFAVRRPDQVGRMVLFCPSGVGGEEKLPIVEGVRHNDFEALIGSVFHRQGFVDPIMVRHYEKQFANKAWRRGILRTVRGTGRHSVRDKLPLVARPTMIICGAQDRIVDSEEAQTAVMDLPCFRFVMLPKCGHAPQIERARVVNRLVIEFLRQPDPEPVAVPHEELITKTSYA
jgi:pimeloyl-ACP methyl ester carboxylesterase